MTEVDKLLGNYKELKNDELKELIRNEIFKECGIKAPTFYLWLGNRAIPKKWHEIKVLKILNKYLNNK